MSKRTVGFIGIGLIALGILSLISGGIPYTSQETVLNMGPVKVEADTQEKLSLPPVVGILALAGGILLLVGSRKTT